MTKRKPSGAKKRADTRTPKSRVQKTRKAARHAPRPTDSVALPTHGEEIFYPQENKRFSIEAPDDDEDVFVPVGYQFEIPMYSGLPRDDINAALNESFNTSPKLSPGFNDRGVCVYGCDGMVSIKDPMLGLHAYACPFWDTAEGIGLMLRFEKTDFPPFK
jgi:hypothetical protein